MTLVFGSVKGRLITLVATLVLFILLNGAAGMLSGARMIDAFATTYNDRVVPLQCRIPDAHLSKRIWKLALAREGMGMLLQAIQQQQR